MCLKFCSKKGSDRLSATPSNNTPRHNHHVRFTDEAPRQSGPGRDNDPCLRANPHHSPQEQPRSPDSSSSPSDSRLPCNSSFRSPSSANHSNPPVHRPCKFNRLSAGCRRHNMTSYPCCCNPSTPTADSPPSCNCHEHLLWEFRFGCGHCCCTGCQQSYEVNEEVDDWNYGAKGKASQTDCNVMGSKPDHNISTGNGKRDSTQRSRSPNAGQQRAQPYQASVMINSKPWGPPYVLVNGVPFTPQVQAAQLPQIQTTTNAIPAPYSPSFCWWSPAPSAYASVHGQPGQSLALNLCLPPLTFNLDIDKIHKEKGGGGHTQIPKGY